MSSSGDKSGLEEIYENLQFQLMIPWEKPHLQVGKLCLESIKNQQFVGDNCCLSWEQLSQSSGCALGTLLVPSLGWRDEHSICIHPKLSSLQWPGAAQSKKAIPGSNYPRTKCPKEARLFCGAGIAACRNSMAKFIPLCIPLCGVSQVQIRVEIVGLSSS